MQCSVGILLLSSMELEWIIAFLTASYFISTCIINISEVW